MSADPVCGDDEPIRMETGSGTYAFKAAVSRDDGVVTLSPVPERVSPGRTVGLGVKITAESLEGGWYIWGDHTVTDVGTQVVRLTKPRGVDQ